MNAAGASHGDALQVDESGRVFGADGAMLQQVAAERPCGAARCGILDNPESRGQHPAVRGCVTVSIQREYEQRHFGKAGARFRSRECSPIDADRVNRRPSLHRRQEIRDAARHHLHRQRLDEIHSTDADRRREGRPLLDNAAEGRVRLGHPRERKISLVPLECDRCGPNAKFEHELLLTGDDHPFGCQRECAADCWMAGDWQFLGGGEYAHLRIAAVLSRKDERRLRERHLLGDPLHLRRCEAGCLRKDGKLVAFERPFGEDVEVQVFEHTQTRGTVLGARGSGLGIRDSGFGPRIISQ